MKKLLLPLVATVLLPLVASAQAPATTPTAPLIPRDALFGNPDKTQARLSPDGKYLSYIAPKDGVLNVFVGPANDVAAAKAVTSDSKRGIRQHFWAYTSKHVLFLQDEAGDENWHLYVVNVETGELADLTPFKNINAQPVAQSWKRPNSILVAINNRLPEWHDLYEIDIETGARKLIERNDQEFGGYDADLDFKPRVAFKSTPDGNVILRRTPTGWVTLLEYGREDSLTTNFIAIEGSGKAALMRSSVGRDKAALVRVDLATGKQSMLATSEQADINDVWLDPKTRAPQAYIVNYLKPETTPLVASIRGDLTFLTAQIGENFDIVSRTHDDSKWIVVTDEPQAPATSHLYDRKARTITKLFDQRPQLAGAPLVPMEALELKARDGLTLVAYLSLPPGSDKNGDGRPDAPVPLVLNVHGGPWARDVYGFDAEHQWLANRGYAALSVNFRGSTGFGKAFINASNREWAGKMHDDLLDAVQWAISEKVTTADKVGIYGGSYGGYATLVGLTFTPDAFACGVDIVGPSNLLTLLSTIPPYWKSFFEEFAQRVGDPRTEEGKKFLLERSPLTRVDAIKRPLLIAQGANDPRVKQAESDQIVAAMKAKGLPVTYVLYPDEGHGFARPANRTSFYAVSEAFLSKCLAGRYEPVGDDFTGASLKVLEGTEHVPGLSEALAPK